MSRGRAMRIGEVAGRARVPAKTIRFWEDRRLLPQPARTPSGYRDYDPAILERIAFIRHAQAAGLTLQAIGQVLEVRDGGQPPCVHVSSLIARRLAEVEARRSEEHTSALQSQFHLVCRLLLEKKKQPCPGANHDRSNLCFSRRKTTLTT